MKVSLDLDLQSNEMVVFYNAENLFIPDKTIKGTLALERSGLRNWDIKKYENKLFKIANVFEMLEERNGVPPFLVGLSEIQGRKPLEDLLKLNGLEKRYDFVHYESMDERGVDVALLYDHTKIQIVYSEPISFFFEIEDDDPNNYDTTRDILFCKAKYNGLMINIFVLHLPSKRDLDINRPKRLHILKEIKERIHKIIHEQNEAVIVMGDFNENPNDESITQFIIDNNNSKILTNPFLELFENKIFSTFHHQFGLVFDQVILSNHFFTQKDFPLLFESSEIFNHEKISNWDRKYKGRPFRTYAGTRYLGGYSDHFPVFVKFRKNNL